MGWFTKTVEVEKVVEPPTLVRFANGKYGVRRVSGIHGYQMLDMADGKYWWINPKHWETHAQSDMATARKCLAGLSNPRKDEYDCGEPA